MFLLVAGCVEYGVNPPPPPPTAEVDVVPTAIDLPMVCGTAVQEVEVRNTGTGDLGIAAITLEGDGWSMAEVVLPAVVAPGDALGIELRAVDGAATLTITTDDADEPTITVPLAAAVNTPPDALILSPSEEEFLEPDQEVVMEAVVDDDQSPPEDLVVTWTSELTGEVAVTTPDADGRVETPWPAAERAAGPQVLGISVLDPCDVVGTNTVFFCQDGPWEVATVLANGWLREGDATVDQEAGSLALGPGAAAAFDGFGIYDPDQLDVAFDVVAGGAGFSLTALDADRRSEWIGGGGCGLGFGDCDGGTPLPGWSLVFDLAAGDGNDCGEPPTVGFTFDGAQSDWQACAPLPAGFDDGAAHTVEVHVGDGAVTVDVDGAATLDAAVTLPAYPAYLGFTGAEGSYSVEAVYFTDFTCDCVEACDN